MSGRRKGEKEREMRNEGEDGAAAADTQLGRLA